MKPFFGPGIGLAPLKVRTIFVGVEAQVFFVPVAGFLGIFHLKENFTNTRYSSHRLAPTNDSLHHVLACVIPTREPLIKWIVRTSGPAHRKRRAEEDYASDAVTAEIVMRHSDLNQTFPNQGKLFPYSGV